MWHVLQAAPNRERQVAQLLAEHDVLTYFPRFPKGRRTRPGSVRDQRARCVFPGYVFFRIPLELHDCDAISTVAGVRRVLLEDGRPGAVSDAVIERLQRRLDDDLAIQPCGPFVRGEHVVIEHGPLAAVDAIFDRELDKHSRVQVLVHLMGRPLSVRIDPNHIRPVTN